MYVHLQRATAAPEAYKTPDTFTISLLMHFMMLIVAVCSRLRPYAGKYASKRAGLTCDASAQQQQVVTRT